VEIHLKDGKVQYLLEPKVQTKIKKNPESWVSIPVLTFIND
jgi:hypothetical protein